MVSEITDPTLLDIVSRAISVIETSEGADEHGELLRELRQAAGIRQVEAFDPHTWERIDVYAYTRPEALIESSAIRQAIIKAVEGCDPTRDHGGADFTEHGQPTNDPEKVMIVVQVIPAD